MMALNDESGLGHPQTKSSHGASARVVTRPLGNKPCGRKWDADYIYILVFYSGEGLLRWQG